MPLIIYPDPQYHLVVQVPHILILRLVVFPSPRVRDADRVGEIRPIVLAVEGFCRVPDTSTATTTSSYGKTTPIFAFVLERPDVLHQLQSFRLRHDPAVDGIVVPVLARRPAGRGLVCHQQRESAYP